MKKKHKVWTDDQAWTTQAHHGQEQRDKDNKKKADGNSGTVWISLTGVFKSLIGQFKKKP